MVRQLSAGIAWGLALAMAYSGLLLAITLLPGGTADTWAGGLPFTRFIAAYFAGGLLAGIVRGLLWPRARNALHSVLAGVATALPFFAAVRLALQDRPGRSMLKVLEVATLASIAGGWLAPIHRRAERSPT